MPRFFDFRVNDVSRPDVGRTVIDADNGLFTMLALNTNPIRFDYEYAANAEFGKPLVNSCFTLSLVVGMTVVDVSQNGINLGWQNVWMPNGLFVGDTIRAGTEVTQVRESKSRPNMGIVSVRSRGVNQHGDVVIELERSVLVYRRDAGPGAGMKRDGGGEAVMQPNEPLDRREILIFDHVPSFPPCGAVSPSRSDIPGNPL